MLHMMLQVQGVFFRAGTIDEAKRLGLVGHVENNPDSTVTGEAQGNAQAIAKLKVSDACNT